MRTLPEPAMNRRRFLTGALALPAAALSAHVHAASDCRVDVYGSPQCHAWVELRDIHRFAALQAMDQWCWAACISMVFAHHGRAVSQQRIVEAAYGAAYNMPALSGAVIARQISRPWVDDHGHAFNARMTGVFDFDNGIMALDNAGVVAELEAGRPMIIGSGNHAMVLVGVNYVRTPFGPRIHGAHVFDPWPGRGIQPLSGAAITSMPRGSLRFLASCGIV